MNLTETTTKMPAHVLIPICAAADEQRLYELLSGDTTLSLQKLTAVRPVTSAQQPSSYVPHVQAPSSAGSPAVVRSLELCSAAGP